MMAIAKTGASPIVIIPAIRSGRAAKVISRAPMRVGQPSADLHCEDGRGPSAKEHDRDLRCIDTELVAKRRERAAETADHRAVRRGTSGSPQ